jgi:hypothetical protein
MKVCNSPERPWASSGDSFPEVICTGMYLYIIRLFCCLIAWTAGLGAGGKDNPKLGLQKERKTETTKPAALFHTVAPIIRRNTVAAVKTAPVVVVTLALREIFARALHNKSIPVSLLLSLYISGCICAGIFLAPTNISKHNYKIELSECAPTHINKASS